MSASSLDIFNSSLAHFENIFYFLLHLGRPLFGHHLLYSHLPPRFFQFLAYGRDRGRRYFDVFLNILIAAFLMQPITCRQPLGNRRRFGFRKEGIHYLLRLFKSLDIHNQLIPHRLDLFLQVRVKSLFGYLHRLLFNLPNLLPPIPVPTGQTAASPICPTASLAVFPPPRYLQSSSTFFVRVSMLRPQTPPPKPTSVLQLPPTTDPAALSRLSARPRLRQPRPRPIPPIASPPAFAAF